MNETMDMVCYQGEEYFLIWDGKLVPFMREKFPVLTLPRNAFSTGSNEYAIYGIEDNTFYLQELGMLGLLEPYPSVGDIEAEKVLEKYHITRSERKRRGTKQKEIVEFGGWVKYAPLSEPLTYSGRLIIGQGHPKHPYTDLQQYYHACKKLKSITLVDGQVSQVEDFSEEAAKVRKLIPTLYARTDDERQLVSEFRNKVNKWQEEA